LDIINEIAKRLTDLRGETIKEVRNYSKNLQLTLTDNEKEEVLNSLFKEYDDTKEGIKNSVESTKKQIKEDIEGKIESLFYEAAGRIEDWVNSCYTNFLTTSEQYWEVHSNNIKSKFEQLFKEVELSNKISKNIQILQEDLLSLMNKYLSQKQNIVLSHQSVSANIILPSIYNYDSDTDIGIGGVIINLGGIVAILTGVLRAIPVVNILGNVAIFIYAIYDRRRMKAKLINSYKSYFRDRDKMQSFSSMIFENIVNSLEYKELINRIINPCYNILEDDRKQIEKDRETLNADKDQITKEIQEVEKFIKTLADKR
jgi:hypothetical protein